MNRQVATLRRQLTRAIDIGDQVATILLRQRLYRAMGGHTLERRIAERRTFERRAAA